jgi:hypothetical protein
MKHIIFKNKILKMTTAKNEAITTRLITEILQKEHPDITYLK